MKMKSFRAGRYLMISARIHIRMLSCQSDSNLRIQNRIANSHSSTVVGGRMLGQYVTNGGDGPNSYAQNSSYQGGVLEVAKPIIEEEISKKLDVKHHSSTFRIADFGCSTGHNSFAAMKIITEAIKRKLETDGQTSHIPDFQVFFNDKVANDFNTLFSSLPSKRLYYASGVPGSFHGRLLPKASLHFAYSSYTLNWLSEVPKEVEDDTSPTWNRGKIHCFGARKEVLKAYSNQYVKDVEAFLESRAEELVAGGLMALIVPAVPAFWNPNTAFTSITEFDILGSCLMDLAEKGRFSKAKVDSFNLPLHYTVPQEFEAILERSHNYTLERMEIIDNPGKCTLPGPKDRASFVRAVFEQLLTNHFGSEIIDELFHQYAKKIAASPLFLDPENDKTIMIFVLLKRKPYDQK
ncbi:probable S-adenosylmethionine-dependent methyltransferase At5g38780 [Sesamum indicum]|uniref:Probable S-adenosylmethionine-dependent methyltransferase At5g38780 n=1 Tax=Sesamum indicum TaxID=4182 RepID=A0A6I9SKJ0_SESIN|nr:probable S-adenosylmethionine-dependent methyltransferase At5g38780 [Sesamum indicum]